MQEPSPEVEVLLPERLVEAERLVKYPWSSCDAVESACRRLIRPSIGLPGMSRGIAQSIVTATTNVVR